MLVCFAAARDDVRTCYLKDTLQRDPDIMAYAYSYAPPYLHQDYPEVTTVAPSLQATLLSLKGRNLAEVQKVENVPHFMQLHHAVRPQRHVYRALSQPNRFNSWGYIFFPQGQGGTQADTAPFSTAGALHRGRLASHAGVGHEAYGVASGGVRLPVSARSRAAAGQLLGATDMQLPPRHLLWILPGRARRRTAAHVMTSSACSR